MGSVTTCEDILRACAKLSLAQQRAMGITNETTAWHSGFCQQSSVSYGIKSLHVYFCVCSMGRISKQRSKWFSDVPQHLSDKKFSSLPIFVYFSTIQMLPYYFFYARGQYQLRNQASPTTGPHIHRPHTLPLSFLRGNLSSDFLRLLTLLNLGHIP